MTVVDEFIAFASANPRWGLLPPWSEQVDVTAEPRLPDDLRQFTTSCRAP